MDDLATLTGQPKVMTVGGVEYKIYPLTISDFGKIQAWIDTQFPDPFEQAKKAIAAGDVGYPQQKLLFELAMEKATKAKRKIGMPEADEMLNTLDGSVQILLLSIRKGKPDFSDADAEQLFHKMTLMDLTQLYSFTNLDMVISDPKDVPLNIVPPSKTSGSAAAVAQVRRKKR